MNRELAAGRSRTPPSGRELGHALALRTGLLAALLATAVLSGIALKLGSSDPSARAGTHTPEASSRAVVSFAAVGDIAMVANSDGGASYFAAVKRYLRGGVVLGNLEGTLTERGASKCGSGSSNCFAFRAPRSYVSLLTRAGFTIMNLANNHAYDYGPGGLTDTVAALDRAGLRHTGRPDEITVLKVRGVKVAVLGFASYPWAQSLTDVSAARALVRKADATADLVVVTMHAGAEGSNANHVRQGVEYFLGENRGDPVAFTHAVVDAGADLVVGHGPHVLRAIEWYRGRLIAYSMGNFVGCHTLSTSGVLSLSGVLRATLRANGSWVRGELVPVRMVGCGVPERDPAEAAHGFVRELSKQDFGRRGIRISRTGILLPPR
jgi:poly-gamma-glutamate capsule biosynthesis protein CapA/YwtB (metallophosphatase superfamily)